MGLLMSRALNTHTSNRRDREMNKRDEGGGGRERWEWMGRGVEDGKRGPRTLNGVFHSGNS